MNILRPFLQLMSLSGCHAVGAVSDPPLWRRSLHSLRMVWKTMGPLQACELLLVIVSLPQGGTSSVVTVNGRTENYVLDTPSGVQASLECAVQNHTRDEELLWYREDGRVDLRTGNKINTSSVCVSPISVDDDGVNFTCKLQRNQTVSVSVVLNVTFPPLLSGDNFQTVEEDSDVSLVCNVKANPQAQMEWRKDNDILVLEKGRHQIRETRESFQLSIPKVKKSDNGTYSCVASSALKVETMDFHLVVKDKVTGVPIEAIIAACVVVFLTLAFGLFARRKRIMKLCVKEKNKNSETAL